jgi:hypothetical protein
MTAADLAASRGITIWNDNKDRKTKLTASAKINARY